VWVKIDGKKYKVMEKVTIDINSNVADLQTAVANFQTAFAALQGSTLANLTQALADLDTAQQAIAAFQLSFTVSTEPAA